MKILATIAVMIGTLMAPYTCCCAGLNLPRANCCSQPMLETVALPVDEPRECCGHCCDVAPAASKAEVLPVSPWAPKEKCPRCADRFIPKLIVPSTEPAIEFESVLLEIIPINQLKRSLVEKHEGEWQSATLDPGNEVRYRLLVCHHVMRC